MVPHQTWAACFSPILVLLSKVRPLPPKMEITLAVPMKKVIPFPPDVEIILAMQMQIRPCDLSDMSHMLER